jgi:N-dimethylarginine dimethylaminohydrolase
MTTTERRYGARDSTSGIPTAGRIEAPGTVEGGDTVWLRDGLFVIGRTLRTNDAGAKQLAAIVGGDVRVVVVAEGNPVTRRGLEAAGVEVHAVPLREVGENGSGGVTCLTRPILRG